MWYSGTFDYFVAVAEAESLTVAAKTKRTRHSFLEPQSGS